MVARPGRASLVALVALTLFTLVLAPVTAQVEGPLVAKVDEKRAAAEEDPAGYAARQTSESQLADDANWTIAYGCYLGHTAADETGLPPPELASCAGFEEAIGIAEEEEQAEAAVAEAEGLEDATAAEAEAIAEDLQASLGAILEDPTTAPGVLSGFLARTLAALERILGGIGTFAGDTVEGLGLGMGLLAKGAGVVVAAPVVAVLFVVDAATDLFTTVTTGTALAIGATGDGIAAALDATGRSTAEAAGATQDALTTALDTVTTTAETIVSDVSAALSGLFGGDATPTQRLPEPPAGPTTDLERTTGGLEETVTDLVDRA